MNLSELAIVLGVSRGTARNWLLRRAAPAPGTRRCIWLVEQLIRLHGPGVLIELALWTDLSPPAPHQNGKQPLT